MVGDIVAGVRVGEAGVEVGMEVRVKEDVNIQVLVGEAGGSVKVNFEAGVVGIEVGVAEAEEVRLVEAGQGSGKRMEIGREEKGRGVEVGRRRRVGVDAHADVCHALLQ